MTIWTLDPSIQAEFIAFMARHRLTKPWRLRFSWQCFFQLTRSSPQPMSQLSPTSYSSWDGVESWDTIPGSQISANRLNLSSASKEHQLLGNPFSLPPFHCKIGLHCSHWDSASAAGVYLIPPPALSHQNLPCFLPVSWLAWWPELCSRSSLLKDEAGQLHFPLSHYLVVPTHPTCAFHI